MKNISGGFFKYDRLAVPVFSPLINSLCSNLCKDFEASLRNTCVAKDKICKGIGAKWTGMELQAWFKYQNGCQRAYMLAREVGRGQPQIWLWSSQGCTREHRVQKVKTVHLLRWYVAFQDPKTWQDFLLQRLINGTLLFVVHYNVNNSFNMDCAS